MYDKEEATEIWQEIKSAQQKTDAEIIQNGLKKIALVLNTKPEYYKSFGPYWWGIKFLFQKYLSDSGKWYCNGYIDQPLANKFCFDEDNLTFAVSVYYSGQNDFMLSDEHIVELPDGSGEEKVIIYDEDAPTL